MSAGSQSEGVVSCRELLPLEASDHSTRLRAGLAAIYRGACSALGFGPAGRHSLRGGGLSRWLTGHQVIV